VHGIKYPRIHILNNLLAIGILAIALVFSFVPVYDGDLIYILAQKT
jgi:hypothetical protein